jgi:uncharacterized protein YegL
MKENMVEIVFILDRSGSMSGLEQETIDGFNEMIEKQRHVEGRAIVSTVLFDHMFEVIHDRVDLKNVSKMTNTDYYVRGTTALLDAIGRSIVKIDRIQREREENRPKTLFIITTDGRENASRAFRYADLKALIERQKQDYGWEFLFLGANIDAAKTAKRFGIDANRSADYHADEAGTRQNFEVLGDAIHSFRENRMTKTAWKNRIDEDYKNRKK